MPKQGENHLWGYFKISNEDASKAVCKLCKKKLSRGSKDPHKMTTTTNHKAEASAHPYFIRLLVHDSTLYKNNNI